MHTISTGYHGEVVAMLMGKENDAQPMLSVSPQSALELACARAALGNFDMQHAVFAHFSAHGLGLANLPSCSLMNAKVES